MVHGGLGRVVGTVLDDETVWADADRQAVPSVRTGHIRPAAAAKILEKYSPRNDAVGHETAASGDHSALRDAELARSSSTRDSSGP
jgi:hypothetical protein